MTEVYPIGKYYELMPIPVIPEHCITRAAGPIQLVVESRQLTDELAGAGSEQIAAFIAERGTQQMQDYGASLHVFGTEDGLEHLRFDCFDQEPHYHYIRQADGAMVICRIDDIAEGDPIQWTIGRLRERLPEMLTFAHAPQLAEQVREAHDEIHSAIDGVAKLLTQAHERAKSLADESA
jgi:hypothetical protein